MYYIGTHRSDARCYGCGSKERTRLLALYLLCGHEPELAGGTMLEVGPETYTRSFLPNDVDYISFDSEPGRADVRGDLCAAPFDDRVFDYWICFHVLDVIQSDRLAIAELHRTPAPRRRRAVRQPDRLARVDDRLRPKTAQLELPLAPLRRRRRRATREAGFEVALVRADELFAASAIERFGLSRAPFIRCTRA